MRVSSVSVACAACKGAGALRSSVTRSHRESGELSDGCSRRSLEKGVESEGEWPLQCRCQARVKQKVLASCFSAVSKTFSASMRSPSAYSCLPFSSAAAPCDQGTVTNRGITLVRQIWRRVTVARCNDARCASRRSPDRLLARRRLWKPPRDFRKLSCARDQLPSTQPSAGTQGPSPSAQE